MLISNCKRLLSRGFATRPVPARTIRHPLTRWLVGRRSGFAALLGAGVMIAGTAALADIAVRFDEGAPKDRFSFTNIGACPLGPLRITLDLGSAPAGLIFDVTAAGAGVDVFQPFEMVAGTELLLQSPQVVDGDAALVLDLKGLAVSETFAFTIDVDDTGGGREITVSGSEIAGANVAVALGEASRSAAFDDSAQARVPVDGCLS